MNTRADFYTASKEAFSAMIALEKAGSGLGIDPRLLDLIRLRASQINGCAFCIDMHTSDARKAGESERRLATLPAWRETPSSASASVPPRPGPKSLTNIAETHAPDADYGTP